MTQFDRRRKRPTMKDVAQLPGCRRARCPMCSTTPDRSRRSGATGCAGRRPGAGLAQRVRASWTGRAVPHEESSPSNPHGRRVGGGGSAARVRPVLVAGRSRQHRATGGRHRATGGRWVTRKGVRCRGEPESPPLTARSAACLIRGLSWDAGHTRIVKSMLRPGRASSAWPDGWESLHVSVDQTG